MSHLPQILAALLLVTLGSIPTSAAEGEPENQSREIDERLFEWCEGFLLGGSAENPIERPVRQLRPFDMKDKGIPADLITQTQILGTLPPEIEKYQGTWIRPSAAGTDAAAVFIERLSPSEMTIALVIRSTSTGTVFRRSKLIWSGTAFLDTEPWPKGLPTMSVRVSPLGDALSLAFLSYLTDAPEKSTETPKAEAWPMCFISAKHY